MACWNENPQAEVTKEIAAKSITKIEYQDTNLIHSVWTFLQRRGFINHGDFKVAKLQNNHNLPHIAVVGGGISGKNKMAKIFLYEYFLYEYFLITICFIFII